MALKFEFLAYSLLGASALILFIFVILVYCFDLLAKFKVEEMTFNEILVYLPYKGNYSNMVGAVNKVYSDAEKENLGKSFKEMKGCGVYYDDPAKRDPNQCRALVGFFAKDIRQAENFVSKHKEYKIYEVSDLRCFGAVFPFYNLLSMLFAVKRGYPALDKYIKDKKLNYKRVEFQVYDYINKKYIMSVPMIDESHPLIRLSGFSQPSTRKDE